MSPAAGRAREPRDVAIKYFKKPKKPKQVKGFPAPFPGRGSDLSPGAPALLFPGWKGERGSSGMVMEPNSFLQGSRGSTSLPAGWRAMGAAQVSARSALCSPACGLFQIKPEKAEGAAPAVGGDTAALGTAQGAAGAPLRATHPAVTVAAGPREVQPAGKVPPWFSSTVPGAGWAGGPRAR